MKSVLLCLVAAVISAPLSADCIGEARRQAAVSAAGIRSVRIIGRAGTLTVQGRNGLGQIRASGVACASSRALVDDIRIEVSRNGSEITVEAAIPENGLGGSIWPFGIGRYAQLDLVVEIPDNLRVKVIDGSGEAWIRDVASADVRDGSGALEITNARGNLRVVDGSGAMVIRNVRGSATVESDGSGSIEVSDVGGNFIVKQDGSGGIDHSRVRGQVRIPRD